MPAGISPARPRRIRRTKFTAGSRSLRAFIEHEHVVGLVVGLPLNMDGSDSPRTQSVRAFARNLAPLDLPILLWDERWSTQAVERAMIEADVSRARRAEKVDALAAAHILQGAIDALANLAGAAISEALVDLLSHRFADRRADRDDPRPRRPLFAENRAAAPSERADGQDRLQPVL